jgi:plasmid segregation protein ParM
MIIGIDGGNYETKIVTPEGAFKFRSCLGEYRDFNLDKGAFTEDDMIYEYQGNKGFAGTLAENEALFLREMAGDTKAHEDAILRILISIHRFAAGEEHDIIVGQPIKKHKAEKGRIIEMLKGKHTISVNGFTKTFYIRNVSVAPEGAGAFWAYGGEEERIRIIDVGSGTVNCASISNGRFIDRDSDTLKYGANSVENLDVSRLADAIIAWSSKRWNKTDCVRVCGGIAEMIKPTLSKYFTDIQVIKPVIKQSNSMKLEHPVFANAAGFYHLARNCYE